MGEPIPYTPTLDAQVLTLRSRVGELEREARRLDRATLNLAVYAASIDGLPDADEWRTVLELVEEVRGGTGSVDG
ncbi:MAG TPA: hypothetical protein VIG24_14215 [Acidimicrobiia bacterium]